MIFDKVKLVCSYIFGLFLNFWIFTFISKERLRHWFNTIFIKVFLLTNFHQKVPRVLIQQARWLQCLVFDSPQNCT